MSRTFRAMVWREMREHAGAALFAFVGVALFLLLSMGMGRSIAGGAAGAGDVEMRTVMVSSAAAVGFNFGLFTLTSALAGLMLGRAVVAGDRWGDERAFLVHRPVSASEIFFSKALAAALLYLLAAGIPLFLRTLWNATPAHQAAPYDFRLALPEIADFTAGFVYALGGMLMGLRRRSFRDRGLLAVGGPLMCSILTLAVSEFWQAELLVIASILVVGIAARETFTAIGAYESQSRSARTSLAAIVGLGWLFAGMVVLMIASIFTAVGSSVTSSTTITVLAANGQLVRATQRFDASLMRSGHSPWSIQSVTDLSGHPLPAFQDSAARDNLTSGVLFTRQIPLVPEHARSLFDDRGYRSTNRVFVPLFAPTNRDEPMAWYFVRRSGVVAGYDLRTSRLAGWIGPDGFQTGPQPPTRGFQGELRTSGDYPSIQMLAFPHDVYHVDFGRREVRRIFAVGAGETVTGAATSGDTLALFLPRTPLVRPDTTQRFDAIATSRAVYVRSRTGDSLLTFVHDPSVAGYGSIAVSRAPGAPGYPTVIRYDARNGSLDRTAQRAAPDRAFVFTNQSPVAERLTVPGDVYNGGPTRLDWTDPVAAFVSPLVVRVAGRLDDAKNGQRPDLPDTPVMWLLTVLGSLIAGAATFAIARRSAFSTGRTALWTTAALGFGFVGLLTMLALVSRPARETCPTCGRKRVVTRELCEHCGAPFPLPAVDGTEIFEPVGVSQSSS